MYDVNSKCADDFINHEEILATLAYADENKENVELIDSIIEKAKKRIRKSINLPSRSRRTSTATVSLCLRRSISPTTASTAVHTARTMQRINTSRGSSSLRKTSAEKS